MAHKVIVPQKKIMSRSFLNSGTLIVNVCSILPHPSVINISEVRRLPATLREERLRAMEREVAIITMFAGEGGESRLTE